MRLTTFFSLLLLSALFWSAPRALGQIVGSDNADNPAYGPFPNNNWSSVNGGFGYNPWTVLGDTTAGGGRYMEGVGVNGQQVEGLFSFGLFCTNGISSVSRRLNSTINGYGEFEITTRFVGAMTNTLNAVSLRAGNLTNTFASGEQLAFGLIHTSVLGYSDFNGFHALSSFDAGTNAWKWKITFNTITGNYIGTVITNGGGLVATWNGRLELNDTLGPVDSFGVINSGNGRVIFDAPQFFVPEPAAMSLGALAFGALIFWRRKRNTES